MISTIFQAAVEEVREYLAAKIIQLGMYDNTFSNLSQLQNKFWLNFNLYAKTAWNWQRPPLYRGDINEDQIRNYQVSGRQKDIFINNAQIVFLTQLERAIFSRSLTPTRALGHFITRMYGQRSDYGVFEKYRQRIEELNS